MARRAARRWTVLTVAIALLVGATVPAGADEETGSISGTVTSATDSVEGYSAAAYRTLGGAYRAVVVNEDGTYTISDLPPGDYKVTFSRWTGELETQYWPDVIDDADAAWVTVVAGETVTGIDADLKRRPAISGTVTGPDGPIEDALVFVLTGFWRRPLTAADGTYRIPNLPVGDHVVCATDPTGAHHPRCFDGVVARRAATPVSVDRGEEATGIDVTLLPASAAVFPDTVGSSFNQEIAWLSAVEVVDGYPDGTYHPGGAVSRQAMAAFLYRLLDPEGYEPHGGPTFRDVPLSHPFYREIEWLADSGIATGYGDGTFNPNGNVSRQAMAAFLMRAADGEPWSPGTATFPDVPEGHRFFGEIEWLAHWAITSGATFRPGDPVSRQAMAAFLSRLPVETRFRLVLNRMPNPPVALRTTLAQGGECPAGGGLVRIPELSPRLSARIADPDGNLQGVFEVFRQSDGARVWGPFETGVQAPTSSFHARVPEGVLQEGVRYRWQVRGLDTDGRTGPASSCSFVVDRTPPEAPTVTPLEGATAVYREGVWTGGVGQEGWFEVRSASPEVAWYEYSFNSSTLTNVLDASDPIIRFTPTSKGPFTLRVRALSQSGVPSPVTTYKFYVG